MAKLKEGNTYDGDGGRDDETESDNSWREGERELRQETERDDGEGERWRERTCLIIQHYPCSLFMALLEQPAEAIYTHTVGHGLLP